jgi:hypothetical protein
MAGNAIAGGRIVRIIAVVTGVPPTIVVLWRLATGGAVPPQAWLSVIFSLGMAWLLVRGAWWARGWVITGLALSGIAAAVQLVVGRVELAVGVKIALFGIAAANFVGVWLLGWSPTVQAYFSRENQEAALHLNSQGGA